MRILKSCLVLFFSIWASLAFAQTEVKKDSLSTLQNSKADSTVKNKKSSKLRDPRKASLLSAIFPGAGQFYNRKYWKLPILYGGAFTLGHFINLNHEEYIKTRDAYLQVQAGKPDRYNGLYNTEQLVRLREYWRRNRDLLIIISSFTYLLNIADAAVDAHLSGFDVSDDLSFHWTPMIYMAGNQPVAGIHLALQFN